MKKSFPVALALASSIAVIGCGRNTDDRPVASQTPSGGSTAPAANAADNRDKALVRVVHALPGTPAIDVIADNAPVATSVSYGAVTPYKELPANADNFAIRPAGQESASPLAENSEMITGGNHYTLVAFPAKGDEKPALQVVNDNLEMPSEGKARVRVILASPDVDAIDVKAKNADTELFDDVDFKETTSYTEVDPINAAMEIRSSDGKRTIASPVITLEAGKSYTIVLAGKTKGSPKLDALVIEDRFQAPVPTN